ncbi:hypothetical protein KVR01_012922 [Diaporthe batatas]|uniref:uncharacterized protein n=1 Tax=Diaporthe batatas TaxID=748121 RepID=UPI001D03C582|nr:uncharacterized protein KVR01_012922 [Diaporthe batatas]KAG8157214.1 hypothetical protein KVR01_012922 [Diaporthe batatas]
MVENAGEDIQQRAINRGHLGQPNGLSVLQKTPANGPHDMGGPLLPTGSLKARAKVVYGRDTRPSGHTLVTAVAAAVAAALQATGTEFVDFKIHWLKQKAMQFEDAIAELRREVESMSTRTPTIILIDRAVVTGTRYLKFEVQLPQAVLNAMQGPSHPSQAHRSQHQSLANFGLRRAFLQAADTDHSNRVANDVAAQKLVREYLEDSNHPTMKQVVPSVHAWAPARTTNPADENRFGWIISEFRSGMDPGMSWLENNSDQGAAIFSSTMTFLSSHSRHGPSSGQSPWGFRAYRLRIST